MLIVYRILSAILSLGLALGYLPFIHSASQAYAGGDEQHRVTQLSEDYYGTTAQNSCESLFQQYESADEFCSQAAEEKQSKQFEIMPLLSECIKESGRLKVEAYAYQSSAQAMLVSQTTGGDKANANQRAQEVLQDVEGQLAAIGQEFEYPSALNEQEKAEYRDILGKVAQRHSTPTEHFASCEKSALGSNRASLQSAGLISAITNTSKPAGDQSCQQIYQKTKSDYASLKKDLKTSPENKVHLANAAYSAELAKECQKQEPAKGKKFNWLLLLLSLLAIGTVIYFATKGSGGSSSGSSSSTPSSNDSKDHTASANSNSNSNSSSSSSGACPAGTTEHHKGHCV